MAVIGPQRVKKQTPVYILLLSRQSSIFYLPYFLQIEPQKLLFPKRLSYQFSAFKDLYIQANLHNKFLKRSFTKPWIVTPTLKHHIISIQYPSHKWLPEKSYLDCLRILIMLCLFKDPVVIMKVIMSWLFKGPIVIVAWLNFHHAQSNSKKMV